MKKNRRIKSKPLLFLLAFLLILSVGGTFAYYYQNVTVPNAFKTMTYNVNIYEDYNDDWGNKKVYISNNESSNSSVVIRINYNEMWSKNIDGNVVSLSNTINGTNVVNKNWTSTFTDDFVDGSDGWYYYKKLLSPNETIQILNSITLNNTLIQTSPEYQNYLDFDYKMIFNYEALEPNTTRISNIWNKSAVINGSNVSWN